jgi:hypothetical protein
MTDLKVVDVGDDVDLDTGEILKGQCHEMVVEVKMGNQIRRILLRFGVQFRLRV